MLVLSRKLGEKIMIGDDIVITIVKIDHSNVRIGIEAPQHVAVAREEVIRNDPTQQNQPLVRKNKPLQKTDRR